MDSPKQVITNYKPDTQSDRTREVPPHLVRRTPGPQEMYTNSKLIHLKITCLKKRQVQKGRIQVAEATHIQTRLERLRATCGYTGPKGPSGQAGSSSRHRVTEASCEAGILDQETIHIRKNRAKKEIIKNGPPETSNN